MAIMKRTPLRPSTKAWVRKSPIRTGKQKGFLRHKAKEHARALWTDQALGKKAKLQPIKALTDRAWSAFSKYVRLRDCGEIGRTYMPPIGFCSTCDKSDHWTSMHAGHFVHAGRRNPASYDERNIHMQCPACNTFLHGNLHVYAWKLMKEHGPGIVDELRALKAQSKPLSRTALHEIALKYEAKVTEMLG